MKNILLVLLVTFSSLISYTQVTRKVVILNMSVRNGDTGLSRTLSPIKLLSLAGIPFDTTSNLTTALNYPVILTGTRIQPNVLSNAEITALTNWVNDGGILFTSSLREPLLYPLFGVNTSTNTDQVYKISWDIPTNPAYFDLVDDSLEKTVSIGRSTSVPNFTAKYYTLSTGSALAHYENGSIAMVKNSVGNGFTYALGPDLRDIFTRNEINLDLNAERTYSNGFEVSTDVFVFVIRNIIRTHIPNTVYKYTAPHNYSSVVMVTHDIDSRTSYDTMANFAISENARGINAQYNLTTNFVPNSWIQDIYIGTHTQVQFVQNLGHTLASHSVGHFPDFAEDTIFSFGHLGNDTTNYHPFYNGIQTTNGTILGETEVSKKLIEHDFNVPVRSWRSGHLCYPDSLNLALDSVGYEFNSTFSANNVLTGYPFYGNKTLSFSSPLSKVLEIPLTISDVDPDNPMTSTNYIDMVNTWLNATIKYDRNNASTVLLIHPNRNYKLTAQEAYLENLPASMKAMAFQEFGEYWRKRDSLNYYSILDNGILYIQMTSEYDNRISFVVDTIGIDSIQFYDQNGLPIAMQSQLFGTKQKLYYLKDPNGYAGVTEVATSLDFLIYPNPTGENLNVTIHENYSDMEYAIYSIHGQQISAPQKVTSNTYSIPLKSLNLQQGMYFIQLKTGNKVTNKRFVFVKQ